MHSALAYACIHNGKDLKMDLFNQFINFFGISMLTESSTIIDLINICFSVFVAMFLVCFVLRSLFKLLRFGER